MPFSLNYFTHMNIKNIPIWNPKTTRNKYYFFKNIKVKHVRDKQYYFILTLTDKNILWKWCYLRLLINIKLFSYWKLESWKRGKACGHKPQPLSLPCHILAFLSSGSHEPQLFGLPCHNIFSPAIISFLNDKSKKFRFSKIQYRKYIFLKF